MTVLIAVLLGDGNTFTGVERIIGGASDDNFVFESGGSISGGIDGGGGNDAVVSTNDDNNWIIDSNDGGTLNGNRFSTIGNLIGWEPELIISSSPAMDRSVGIVNGGVDDASLEVPAINLLDFSSSATPVTV